MFGFDEIVRLYVDVWYYNTYLNPVDWARA